MAKHKDIWQFAERIGPHPLWKINKIDDNGNLDQECTGWSNPVLRFVCECGKTKIVKEI